MTCSSKSFQGLSILILGFLLGISPVFSSETPRAAISLISNNDSIKKDSLLIVGVRFKLPEGWETFWRTPGDVGYQSKFLWDGSQNVKQIELMWPWPSRVKNYSFVANVYQKEVIFPVKIIPADFTKSLKLHLKIDYLLCNPSACVPQQAVLNMTLQPGKASPTLEAPLIFKAEKAIPKQNNTDELAIQDLHVTLQNEHVVDLKLSVWSSKGFKTPLLFVESSDTLLFSVPDFTKLDDTHGFFTIQVKKNNALESKQSLDVLLKKAMQFTLVNNRDAISISKTVNSTENAIEPTQNAKDDYFIGSILIFAFLGGLILNLMPCVFPILSLKILTLHAYKNKGRQGIFYTLGVMVSFLIIAFVILSLRALGSMVGWGFQMQSPFFLIVLIFLFTLIALNLYGFFEIPFSLNAHIRWQKTHELMYAFGTGVIACVVTTPCSAPFMATAVGVAINKGNWHAILIFLSLGFGFSLPYLLLCTIPRASSVLPKPGAWMQKIKQFLGFPMLLSVIWLLWVLGAQIGNDSVMLLLVSLCFLVLSFWLLHNIERRVLRLSFILTSLIGVFYPLHWLYQDTTEKTQFAEHYAYTPEKIKNLMKDHRKFFLYATANWCITCKINEKIAIDTQLIKNFFNNQHIAVIKADWTNKNNAILDYLQGFHRAGVPFYIYYPDFGDPIIFPQVLAPSTIIKEIQQIP